MKNTHIAYCIAAFGAVMFLYNIHQISGLEEEAAVWKSQLNVHNNPSGATYFKAFFDGFTLGAFSQGDIFYEANKSEQEGKQLEAARASIVSRYQNAVSYRNWALGIGIGGLAYAWLLKKQSAQTDVLSK